MYIQHLGHHFGDQRNNCGTVYFVLIYTYIGKGSIWVKLFNRFNFKGNVINCWRQKIPVG